MVDINFDIYLNFSKLLCENKNYDCWLRCIICFKDGLLLRKFVFIYGIECVIGIYVWRFGRFLLGKKIL